METPLAEQLLLTLTHEGVRTITALDDEQTPIALFLGYDDGLPYDEEALLRRILLLADTAKRRLATLLNTSQQTYLEYIEAMQRVEQRLADPDLQEHIRHNSEES